MADQINLGRFRSSIGVHMQEIGRLRHRHQTPEVLMADRYPFESPGDAACLLLAAWQREVCRPERFYSFEHRCDMIRQPDGSYRPETEGDT